MCVDDANVRAILPAITKPIVTYGLGEDAQLRAIDVANVGGRMRFVARAARRAPTSRSSSTCPACTTCSNALAAIAVGREVGVADAAIAKALAEFHGVGRRFQRHGEIALAGGGTLHADRRLRPPSGRDGGDDRRGARQLSRAGGWCSRSSRIATRARATCSRTSSRVLSTVDALVLADVYPAGEPPIVAADGRALARALRVAGKVEPVFVEDVADVPAAIRAVAARRRRRA